MPIDAIEASSEITRANLGNAIRVADQRLVVAAGGAVCYVGVVVAASVASLFLVYTYCRVNGAEVAPLTP